MSTEEAMWIFYRLEITVDKLTGGIPKHPEIVRRWQEAHWPAGGDEKAGKTLDAAVAETLETITPDEEVKGIWTGFVEDGGYACLESRNLKAMFKESANIVKNMTVLYERGKPVSFLRAKVAERVFVNPRFIRVAPMDSVMSAERPIHVMTRQGPRTALKRVDYVENVQFTCTVKVLNDGQIKDKTLRTMLDYAQDGGLGTDRSVGSGTFTYELNELC
jgi:hypothetical protein